MTFRGGETVQWESNVSWLQREVNQTDVFGFSNFFQEAARRQE